MTVTGDPPTTRTGAADPSALLADLHARCRFPVTPGPTGDRLPVVCAVSGGADSSALLVLAAAHGLDVEAVHVDHGLRSGGEAEAAFVESLAERFGCRFRAERVEVRDGPGLEARCRDARRAVVGDDALTGHTLDDHAETVLWHLLRGSGLAGVSGIGGRTHPLLALRRAETQALCRALDIVPVVDPTNDSTRFTRNRIRHEVLPLLSDVADRDVVPLLARFAEHARRDERFLDASSLTLDPTDARALSDAPPPLARRAVRRWLTADDPDLHPPEAATVDRVLAVARLETRATDVGGGRRVERHRQRLRLVPSAERRGPSS